jgi:hemoglobin
MSSETSKPTLYERLGGVYSIAAVVDDFIDRVMHNPVLNANAAVDEAHHRVSAAGFKYYVTEMVCWAAGGPQNYTGRSMREISQTPEDYRERVGRLLQGLRRHDGEIQCT